jgi:hypothetical protein
MSELIERENWLRLDSLEARRAFDVKAAALLHDQMDIVGGEASRPDVWTYLTTCIFPDVARWRFPHSATMERFVGGANFRNVFQRLWWRAEILKDPDNPDDPFWLLHALKEDAMVGITERTRFVRNRPLARRTAREIIETGASEEEWRRIIQRARERSLIIEPLYRWDGDAPTQGTSVPTPVISEKKTDPESRNPGVVITLLKRLSANEIGTTGSHQSGFLIPKKVIDSGIFPPLDNGTKNPDCWMDWQLDGSGKSFSVRFIHYNGKLVGEGTRDEYRVTNIADLMRELLPEVDDVLCVQRTDKALRVSLRPSSSLPADVTWMANRQFTSE